VVAADVGSGVVAGVGVAVGGRTGGASVVGRFGTVTTSGCEIVGPTLVDGPTRTVDCAAMARPPS
jgi:hypothetical protein